MASIYDFIVDGLDGRRTSLSEYAGRVLLIVNTASHCAHTPQYADLVDLHRRFEPAGLSVLAFPCNQFGAQEPGTPSEIATFCRVAYDVSFPLFAKIDVNGPNTDPLFTFLKAARPGIFGTRRIKWNFTKFLIDRSGRVRGRYAPRTRPTALERPIRDLL